MPLLVHRISMEDNMLVPIIVTTARSKKGKKQNRKIGYFVVTWSMKGSVSLLRSRRQGSISDNGVLYLRHRNFVPRRKSNNWIIWKRSMGSCYHGKIFVGSCFVLLACCYHLVCFYRLMEKNLIGNDFILAGGYLVTTSPSSR